MNPDDFTRSVETILQAAHVPFERRALLAFIGSAWPLIEDHPDPERWAREFLTTLAMVEV